MSKSTTTLKAVATGEVGAAEAANPVMNFRNVLTKQRA